MALSDYRRNVILKTVDGQGSASVIELAERLKVSLMTIRRDLAELEAEGALRRVHGGAVSAGGVSVEPAYPVRGNRMAAEKARIAHLAASLVADGETISLDCGTTAFEVARCLPSLRNVTVLTPNLHIAGLLLSRPEIRIVVSGGIARPSEGSLVGELAHHAFARLHVDRLFLTVGGLDANQGLSEQNWDDALVKRAMIAGAREVVVVADSGKFGKVAFAHVANLDQVHKVITDRPPSTEMVEALDRAGVELLVAT